MKLAERRQNCAIYCMNISCWLRGRLRSEECSPLPWPSLPTGVLPDRGQCPELLLGWAAEEAGGEGHQEREQALGHCGGRGARVVSERSRSHTPTCGWASRMAFPGQRAPWAGSRPCWLLSHDAREWLQPAGVSRLELTVPWQEAAPSPLLRPPAFLALGMSDRPLHPSSDSEAGCLVQGPLRAGSWEEAGPGACRGAGRADREALPTARVPGCHQRALACSEGPTLGHRTVKPSLLRGPLPTASPASSKQE